MHHATFISPLQPVLTILALRSQLAPVAALSDASLTHSPTVLPRAVCGVCVRPALESNSPPLVDRLSSCTTPPPRPLLRHWPPLPVRAEKHSLPTSRTATGRCTPASTNRRVPHSRSATRCSSRQCFSGAASWAAWSNRRRSALGRCILLLLPLRNHDTEHKHLTSGAWPHRLRPIFMPAPVSPVRHPQMPGHAAMGTKYAELPVTGLGRCVYNKLNDNLCSARALRLKKRYCNNGGE